MPDKKRKLPKYIDTEKTGLRPIRSRRGKVKAESKQRRAVARSPKRWFYSGKDPDKDTKQTGIRGFTSGVRKGMERVSDIVHNRP